MPDELRLELIGQLDPQREGEIRSAIIALLEKDAPPEKSFDVLWYEFDEVRLDARGVETARNKRRARYLVEDLGGGVKLEMTEIPGGTFQMGTANAEAEGVISEFMRAGFDRETAVRWANEEMPQHQVTVQQFAMGIFEVTQAQWRAVAGFTKVERELNPNPSRFNGDNLPVE